MWKRPSIKRYTHHVIVFDKYQTRAIPGELEVDVSFFDVFRRSSGASKIVRSGRLLAILRRNQKVARRRSGK